MSFTSISQEVVGRTYYIESELKRAIEFLYRGNYAEAACSFEKVGYACKSNSLSCSAMAMCKPTETPVSGEHISNPQTVVALDQTKKNEGEG